LADTHHGGNVLDVLITLETSTLCGKLTVVDPGISDHKLIVVDLHVGRLKPVVRMVKFRKIKSVDTTAFADLLRRTPVYTDPSDDVDVFADQLDQSVISVLDELAPLKCCTRRCGRKYGGWLTETAVAAKRKRRRLERRWNRTGREKDRVAYRSACREANVEINTSRQSFYQKRLMEAGNDHGSRWKVARELLHLDEDHIPMESAEARRLCTQFSHFFINKLRRIATEIEKRMSATVRPV